MRSLAMPLVLLVAALLANARAQEATVLRKWDFEADMGGWLCMDPKGQLSRTNAADVVREGKYALEFSYTQRLPAPGAPEDLAGVIAVELTTPPVGLQSVRFQVSTLYNTPLGVVLRERDGSTYLASVWSESGKWNVCQLALVDFLPMAEQVPDENGRLDPEQIQYLALADGSAFARALAREGAPIFVDKETDTQLWLDEVVLSSAEPDEKGRAPASAQEGRVVIDTCAAPTIHWVSLGGEDPSLTIEQELDAAGNETSFLRVHYITPVGKVFAVMRDFAPGTLAECKALSLQMRAELDTNLIVALEQTDGARFVAPITVKAGKEWQRLDLPLSLFVREQTTSGPGPGLERAKVRRVALADLLPIFQTVMSSNTWQIRDLAGTK